MALSDKTRFQLILPRFAKIVSTSILIFSISTAGLAHADSVNSADKFGEHMLPDLSCLFINEILPEQHSHAIENDVFTDHEVDVFPLEQTISQIAGNIVKGIVNTVHNDKGTNAFADSFVNLDILVGNTVEKSNLEDDPYWTYYLSCDSWGVVFNDEPCLVSESQLLNDEHVEDQSDGPQQHHLITRLKQLYLHAEFLFVEHLGNHQISRTSDSMLVKSLKVLTPLTEITHLSQHGALGIWGSFNERVKIASRFMLGLRFASNIGDQLLESSRQSSQY